MHKKIFFRLFILVFLLLVGLYLYSTRPFTVEDVHAHEWVPDIPCSKDYCHGIVDFTQPDCEIRTDGYIYVHNQPEAKLVSGNRPPWLRESAPRTGGELIIQDLKSGAFCTFNTTD